MTKRTVSVVLFDGFELLDVFGPVELYSMLPDEFAVRMLGPAAGEVASSQGTRVVADLAYADASPAGDGDIVMVPGGMGTRSLVDDEAFVDWLGSWAEAAEVISSVCTGAALLDAARLLVGRRATSNKKAFSWVSGRPGQVEWVAKARWVQDENRWTSSGVAAGMDMTAALIAELTSPEQGIDAASRIELEVHTDPDWDPFAALYDLA